MLTVAVYICCLDVINDIAKDINNYISNRTRDNLSKVGKGLFKLIATLTVGLLASRFIVTKLLG